MVVAILSDVHGNLNALTSVLKRVQDKKVESIILLGDIIDYGMHSNEVIECISRINMPILCNIWGNHENAIMTNVFDRFSSKRGQECAKYTRSILNDFSQRYIKQNMHNKSWYEFDVEGKKCLAVHGSLEDYNWKAIIPGQDLDAYQQYDYVFSGHSHLPLFFEIFYEIEDETHRNKKKTIFVNPGSVGQPRNLCNLSQFVIWDTITGSISMEKVIYDIVGEQAAYCGQVDEFYKIRLETGV